MIAGSGLFMLTQVPFRLFGKSPEVKIVILNTNDTHSRMEPFPMDGGRNQGLGGVAARSKIINQIRAEEENVLLFDSGDIFQGTPYFNFFGGK
jgi:5'-nucleotidase